MTFPSFITTGPTRDITVQPLEHKAFNLLPLIQLLQEDGKKASTSAATTAKTDDTKLEGRVGGVNQIMAEVNKYDNIIKNGINLMGDAFTGTPEYARAVRGREYALSEEVKNTLARETKNLELFKDQSKGKGHYFHLGQYGKTGDLKRASDWQSILEYGKSNDYYGYVGGEFISDFDYTPVFYDAEDSRLAVDEMFKTGYLSSDIGYTTVTEEIIGNTVGVQTAYTQEKSKRNFQRTNEKGEPIGDPQALEYAHNQALARAFSIGGMDYTDPLVGGYFQSFLQKSAGQGSDPFRNYRNEKNIVDDKGLETFFKDFSVFVQEDLQKHKEKRKIDETGTSTNTSFNVSDEGTRALAAKQEEELNAKAWRGINESQADFTDYGLEEKWLTGEKGLLSAMNIFNTMSGMNSGAVELDEKDKQYMYSNTWSPFYKQRVNGKDYVNVREDIDWQEFKENIVADAIKRGLKDPEKHADMIVAHSKIAADRFKEARKNGETYKATGRYDFQAQHMDATQVPEWFTNITNGKDLVGQSSNEMGTNIFAKIGETYMMLSGVNGLEYEGTHGGIKMTSNTLPTNLYTRVIENGQEKMYNWSHDSWRKMTDEQKQKIVDLAQEQSKSNPSMGTMLLNYKGQLDNTVKKDRAVPMDAFAQKTLARLVNDPTSSLNMIYAGPAAITVTGSFKGKTEADIAKAFAGQTLAVELPESYATNPEFAKEWDKIYRYRSQSVKDKDLPAAYERTRVMTTATNAKIYSEGEKIDPKEIAKVMEIPASDYEEFSAYWRKLPNGMGVLSYNAAIADFKIGKRGNYQNVKTVLTNVPISKDGYNVNPIVKEQLGFTKFEKGTGVNKETGFRVFIEYDATGATMKSKTDPNVQRRATDWTNASLRHYNVQNNLIIAEDSKENIKKKINHKTGK